MEGHLRRAGKRDKRFLFGADGKPCLHKDGYAGCKATYDERGNQTSESYFGTDGKPCLHKEGLPDGRAFRRAGKPDEHVLLRHRRQALPVQRRLCRMRRTYDQRGNRTSESYFGVDGKPCLGKHGYAGGNYFYKRGNETSASYFGIDGKPCLDEDGVAGWKAAYDERGNKISESYFDADGKLCLNKGGDAGWKVTYDERGNQTSVSYFGADGKPCLPEDGYAE